MDSTILSELIGIGFGLFCLAAMLLCIRPRPEDCDIDTILANAERPYIEKSR